jgi:hypothetical protein
MPSVVAQPSGFHEFLANRGLAQHEAALSEIGVTELSHIVDVTAEDLIAFMTPDEARRFFSFAGTMTPNAAWSWYVEEDRICSSSSVKFTVKVCEYNEARSVGGLA